MTEPAGDRPQDVGRKHKRTRRVPVAMLGADDRRALLTADPITAYGQALDAASWLYAADALAVVMLRDVLGELAGSAPPGESVVGGPLPVTRPPIAERLRLWSLALELAGELGLTADARRRIGLELTPPDATTQPVASAPAARRRPVDFGGA